MVALGILAGIITLMLASAVAEINPGTDPDGDGLQDIAFTVDGSKILVLNNYTNNVTVFNWASMSIDTTFAISGSPGGFCCSSDYVVIANPFDDMVEVYDLADYSLAASFTVAGSPWTVRIDQNNNIAYIGCSTLNQCEVIDLKTLTSIRTIKDFPVFPRIAAFSYECNRRYIKMSGFEVVADGKYLAVTDGNRSLLFINTSTGKVDHTIFARYGDNVAVSGDGKYLVAWTGYFPASLARVDLSDFTVKSQVTISGYDRSNCIDIAVNYDGSKAYVSTELNVSHIVRFESNDFVTIASGQAQWIGVSSDHSKAISGQNRLCIIDFASEKICATVIGHGQTHGCVSPVSDRITSMLPLAEEKVQFYSFTNTAVRHLGSFLSGSSVEGDGSRRVTVAPDGSVALIGNSMSRNVSILDMKTLEINAFLETGFSVQDAAITSDSKWAVVCGSDPGGVKIIDMATHSIVASISTAERSSVVAISPDDAYAYIANNSGNSVSVVKLNGSSSRLVTNIPCSGQSKTMEANGVYSDVKVSPDGSCCLSVATLDDLVRVIDTATNTVVATVAVGDFPLQAAFNSDGSKAIVNNYLGDSYSVINIDGAASSLLATTKVGELPLRVAYDSVSDQFAVGGCKDETIVTVDPSSGNTTNTHNYGGRVYDLGYTAAGQRIALVGYQSRGGPARVYIDDDHTDISMVHIKSDFCDFRNALVAVSAGPDLITHIAYGTSAVSQTHVNTADMPGLNVTPNPTSGSVVVSMYLPAAGEIKLAVFDLSGRRIESLKEDIFTQGDHSFAWAGSLPTGVYALRLDAGNKTVTRLFSVCR